MAAARAGAGGDKSMTREMDAPRRLDGGLPLMLLMKMDTRPFGTGWWWLLSLQNLTNFNLNF